MKYRVKGTIVPPRGTPGANGAYVVDLDVDGDDSFIQLLKDARASGRVPEAGFDYSPEDVAVVVRSTKDVRLRLERAVKRLYSEDRMNGDAMRDMAQSLEVVLNDTLSESELAQDSLSPARCGVDGCRGLLAYQAEYAAPGRGQAWDCVVCGQAFVFDRGTFSKVGPDDPPPELSPEDVR